jgi:hypothetical protein
MTKSPIKKEQTLRFEAANLEALSPVLDAVSWLDLPDVKQISQFAGVDPRTGGKLLKNCVTLGILQSVDDKYSLTLPYPHKGSDDQKKAVIKEAMVRLPLMVYLKQFLTLGDTIEVALRKAATLIGVQNFEPQAFTPLLKWAKQLDVLNPDLRAEDLVEQAFAGKETRHKQQAKQIVAFLSHSLHDKPIIRQLASDLTAEGITVWLDEQRILVGDSITEKIGQGLAESDYFLIALSESSVKSEWVKKELSAALLAEVERRKVTVLPIKLSESEIPTIIKDKKYADFSKSYKQGFQELLHAMRKEQ